MACAREISFDLEATRVYNEDKEKVLPIDGQPLLLGQK